mmetsp:Transcript_30531/g.57165  ORF Transcript_30531/g.57165 Transcript_30531/m.57165 type:complete len:134 (-) Transcript_30531:231-632(-)
MTGHTSHLTGSESEVVRSKSVPAGGLSGLMRHWSTKSEKPKGMPAGEAIRVDKRGKRMPLPQGKRKPRLGEFFSSSDDIKSEASDSSCSTASTARSRARPVEEIYELSPVAKDRSPPCKPVASDACCMPFLQF